MQIPFLDLKRQHQQLRTELLEAFAQVLDKGIFTGEDACHAFEQAFADFCQIQQVVAVSSGTAALLMALRAAGVKPGDEVLLPAHTCFVCVNAIAMLGAHPIFVDCHPDSWQIDPEQLARHLSKRTRAVLAVHLYGIPCDIEAIRTFCDTYQLVLLEDCSHAHGAHWNGKPVGSFGQFATFSFYPSKILAATGEGGAVAFQEPAYTHMLRAWRNQGSVQKEVYEFTGFNFRMGALEAAALRVKLVYLPKWIEKRKQIAQLYCKEIRNPALRFPQIPPQAEPSYHLFVVQTRKQRNHFLQYLQDQGIGYGLHYPKPCYRQPTFCHLPIYLPHAEHHCAHCVSLPLYPELTESELTYIIEKLNRYRDI